MGLQRKDIEKVVVEEGYVLELTAAQAQALFAVLNGDGQACDLRHGNQEVYDILEWFFTEGF